MFSTSGGGGFGGFGGSIEGTLLGLVIIVAIAAIVWWKMS